ncbi:MAG: GNAT family N-acetyltransferase, partial [Clostridia bacterium]|nr:GNAT family N-acetyltransferase [Clostridia bacterium]
MKIRKLTAGEMADLERAQSVSFVYPFKPDNVCPDDHAYSWGAFDGEGALVGGLLNFPLAIYYDGNAVGMGGIGGVVSLPEARMRGNIRNIFRAVFEEIRGTGGIFSMLFGFSEAYYRQYGYEVCHAAHTYAFPTEQLRAVRQTGEGR